MEPGALAEVRHKLSTHFTKSELQTLCFDLGIDYENLRSDTKDELTREIVRVLNYNERLDNLLAYCRQLRPQVTWPDLPAQIPTSTGSNFLNRESIVRLWNGVEPEKRNILLEKVKKFWITGVLEHTLKDQASIQLNWLRESRFVDHPWDSLGDSVFETTAGASESDDVLKAFMDSDQALLILGEPGSGKTVLLLQLARALIERAEKDNCVSVPVVLNLVSWDGRHNSLEDWVVDELAAKYHIPRNIGRSWLNADALLLLLDGLDEVVEDHQNGCVQAINRFREGQGFTGLTVSSRITPYQKIDIQLKFGGAIQLTPLTDEQIYAFLERQSVSHRQLKQALMLDEELKSMARSPFLLSLMNTVYPDNKDLTDSGLDVQAKAGTFRQQLFTDYTQKMLQERGKDFATDEVLQQLAFLAQKLEQHNQTIFLIDQLQPSWLPTRFWQRLYMMLSRAMSGLVIGIALWIGFITVNNAAPTFGAGLLQILADLLPFGLPWNIFVFELVAHLGLGAATGVVDILLFEYWEKRPPNNERKRRVIHLAAICSVVAILTFIVIRATDNFPDAFISALFVTLFFFVFYLMIHGHSYRQDIRTAEPVRFHWIRAVTGLVTGLILGFILQLVTSNEEPSLSFGLLLFLVGGFSGKAVKASSRSNQGIRQSVYNGAIAFFIGGVVLGLYSFYTYDGSLIAGLLGFVNFALIAGYAFGLGSASKHLLLRAILRWSQRIPWDYQSVLDKAVKLVLLHRVGGGYMFIHRLLQEHFVIETRPL